MAMRRRSLLIGGALVAVGSLLGPIAVISDDDLVKRRLRRHLPDLKMDDDELSRFTTEFLDFYRSRNPGRRDTILLAARAVEPLPPGFRDRVLPSALSVPFARLDRELFHAFFLGTDYFETRVQTDTLVRFYQIPDPYTVGCANTLAQFD